jgi:hypothetical protein
VHRFAQANAEVDLEELRDRLRRMTDEQLRKFGEAAKFMCSPGANFGKPPRKPFVIQLEEARAEWKLRQAGTHPTVKRLENL